MLCLAKFEQYIGGHTDTCVKMNRKKTSKFEFTIVAGELKGRRITAPDLGITRPPLTRLRRSLFDFLMPYIDGAAYLDLFSGTGSYLFEAVSRGAGRVTGIEKEPRLVDAINEQAEKLGVRDRLTCLRDDVFRAVERFHAQSRLFDIVTMAPPQYKGLVNKSLAALQAHAIVPDDGLIICQHDTSETKDIDILNFSLVDRRKYGNTTFTIVAPPE